MSSLESRKVAIVTGAARGIGKAISLRLAHDRFDLGLNDLASNSADLEDVKKEIEALGQKAVTVICDVSNEQEVESMVKVVSDSLGGLDVMVANAGIGPMGSIQESARDAAPYTASKFAVRGLTQSPAMEYGQHGITVNAYAPGYIDTEMTQFSGYPRLKKGELLEKMKQKSVLGHNGVSDDIAGLVSYLASKDSRFMTGQTVTVLGIDNLHSDLRYDVAPKLMMDSLFSSSTIIMSPSKVAIVTGAAQGIGKAISLRLAQDGFDIGINDLHSKATLLEEVKKEIEALGRKAVIAPGDVTIEQDVESMVKIVSESLDGLDVMVANAGIGAAGSAIHETTAADWDHIMNINAKGVFLCYKYAIKQMLAQGKERGGRIIGASSMYGKRGAPFCAVYSASKFAVRGLTQSAAAEYGQHGITVNAYAPGYIDTEMTQIAGIPRLKQGEFLEMGRQQSLLGDNGVPGDIAGLVSYLASKDSRFMTGQTISINAGVFFD